jgi:hypothetical protein
MRKRFVITATTYGVLALAGAVSFSLPESLPVAGAMPPKRLATGQAIFRVSGPVVESADSGGYGDLRLDAVEMPDGERTTRFVFARRISGLVFDGPVGRLRLIAGQRGADSWADVLGLEAQDGDRTNVSQRDQTLFAERMLDAFDNPWLNEHVELSGNYRYEFTIEFEQTMVDDDAREDSFGEVICFERGAGAGNSWLRMQAVDENGAAQGEAIIVSPHEFRGTTPPAHVGLFDELGARRNETEELGGATIDLTRLGVAELRFLKVSSPVAGHDGFTGGETAADFKILGVMSRQGATGVAAVVK